MWCLAPILLDFWDSTPTSYRSNAGIPIANEGQIPYSLPCPLWQRVAAFAVIFLHQYLWQTQAHRGAGPPVPGWWPWGEASSALWCSGLGGPCQDNSVLLPWKSCPETAGGKISLYLPSLFLLELYMQMGECAQMVSTSLALTPPKVSAGLAYLLLMVLWMWPSGQLAASHWGCGELVLLTLLLRSDLGPKQLDKCSSLG